MRDKCLSERGYTYTSRMLQAILVSLTATWARDGRSANADDWHSEGWFLSQKLKGIARTKLILLDA